MTERTTLLQEVGAAFRDNGLTAAITALIGGFIALLAQLFPCRDRLPRHRGDQDQH